MGSIRRECLDHIISFHEAGLRRVQKSYLEYYERTRTYLSLEKDAPIPRRVQLPELGTVVELPKLADSIIDTNAAPLILPEFLFPKIGT
jgi:hypothetical protein